MDSKRIRLLNLKLLVKEKKTASKVAELGVTDPSMLSQILSPKATRDVGDDLARRLEVGCKKLYGWMDHIHQNQWHEAMLIDKREIKQLGEAGFEVAINSGNGSAKIPDIDELNSEAERLESFGFAKMEERVETLVAQNEKILETLERFRRRFEIPAKKAIKNPKKSGH